MEEPFPVFPVPNAPCGVERHIFRKPFASFQLVPNAPCGVERHIFRKPFASFQLVPNAPCGVERSFIKATPQAFRKGS